MIQGILIGRISRAPQSYPLKSGNGSLTAFEVEQTITGGGKTFPQRFKVVAFSVVGNAVEELRLGEGDSVAVAFRSVETEVYESRKTPGKWFASVKVVASGVDRVGDDREAVPAEGDSSVPAPNSSVLARESSVLAPRASVTAPRPSVAQNDINDEDVPF
jgi:hypothetical protein